MVVVVVLAFAICWLPIQVNICPSDGATPRQPSADLGTNPDKLRGFEKDPSVASQTNIRLPFVSISTSICGCDDGNGNGKGSGRSNRNNLT